MSLLDGLKDELYNPLAEANEEMEIDEMLAFDTALEAATNAKLSDEDIAAILNGDDDIEGFDEDEEEEDDDGLVQECACESEDPNEIIAACEAMLGELPIEEQINLDLIAQEGLTGIKKNSVPSSHFEQVIEEAVTNGWDEDGIEPESPIMEHLLSQILSK